MSFTSRTFPPLSPPPGQEDQSARLAASAEVGQVEDTIPMVYQDYLNAITTLREMVRNGSANNCREEAALINSITAITCLLRERGYDA